MWKDNPSEYMDLQNGEGLMYMVPVIFNWEDYYGNVKYNYDATWNDVQKYIQPEMPFTSNKIELDVRDGRIYTCETAQLKGAPSFDFMAEEDGAFVKTGSGGEFLRELTFYTTVRVIGGSRMQNWGLKLSLWNKDKKIKGSDKYLPVNKLRSGVYTFIFTVLTDWNPKDPENEKLQYGVTPEWIDKTNSDGVHLATDDASKYGHDLYYDYYDEATEKAIKNNPYYGTITTKDFNSL